MPDTTELPEALREALYRVLHRVTSPENPHELHEADCATIEREVTRLVWENAIRKTAALVPPPWWTWEVLDETTPSGKTLFRCNVCGIEQPTPDKWAYHGDTCFLETYRQIDELRADLATALAKLEAAEGVVEAARELDHYVGQYTTTLAKAACETPNAELRESGQRCITKLDASRARLYAELSAYDATHKPTSTCAKHMQTAYFATYEGKEGK